MNSAAEALATASRSSRAGENLESATLDWRAPLPQRTVAVRLANRAIDEGADLPMEKAVALEWERYHGVLSTQDRMEALHAFAENARRSFTGPADRNLVPRRALGPGCFRPYLGRMAEPR